MLNSKKVRKTVEIKDDELVDVTAGSSLDFAFEDSPKFSVGEKVEFYSMGMAQLYKGTIQKVSPTKVRKFGHGKQYLYDIQAEETKVYDSWNPSNKYLKNITEDKIEN